MKTKTYKNKQSTNLKKIIFLLILVLCTGVMHGQKKYKLKPQQMSGLKIYMLSGNVSKVTYTNGDFITFDTYGNVTEVKLEDEYAKYAYEKKDRYKYYDEYYNVLFNDSMRIEKWDNQYEDLSTDYIFDAKGRLKQKSRAGYGDYVSISYEYPGDKFLPSKSVHENGWESGSVTTTSLYNYTATDSNGNWTACKVEITRVEYDMDRGEEPLIKKDSKTYERTITYYTAQELAKGENYTGSGSGGSASTGRPFKELLPEILMAILFLAAIGHMVYINFIRRQRYKVVYTPEYFEEQRRNNNLNPESTVEEDEQAWNLLNEAFNTWTVVQTSSGGEEFRKPTKMKHISASAEVIDQAIALAPTNPEVVNRINELTDVINSNEERYFNGSKLLIGVAAAISILLVYLGDFTSMLPFLFGIAIYILASRTPVFLLEKRAKRGMGSVSNGIFSVVFATIAGAQTVRTTTKWSDGSKTVEDDHSQHWIAWILGLIVIFILGAMIALWAMINYVRNYILYI